MLELEKARAQLTELKLLTAADVLESRLQMAVERDATYLSFLVDLLNAELGERHRRQVETKIRQARLPYRKTFEEFDFSFQPSVDPKQIAELRTLSFVARAANVIFLGPPGVGKSHLAVALAHEALEQGISRLLRDCRLAKRMRRYLRPRLLIIDSWVFTAGSGCRKPVLPSWSMPGTNMGALC